MRHRLTFAFAPVLLAAIAFACEDDPAAQPPDVQLPEAGLFDIAPPPQQDVNVPPVTGVTVTVLGWSGPVADVPIVFHDAQGVVLETKTTGADGKATRAEGASMATALLGTDSDRRLVTWTGLEPGDDVTARDVVSTAALGTYEVTHPYFFTDAGTFGATRYTAIVNGCSNFTAGLTVSLAVDPTCVQPTNNAILFRADHDIRFFDLGLGYSFVKNVAAPDGGDDGGIAVTTSDWQHAAELTVDLTGKPAGSLARLIEVSGTTAIENETAPNGGSLDPNPAVFRTAKGFADAMVAFTVTFATGTGTMNVIGERFAASPAVTSKTFDYAQRLEQVTDADVDATDVRRPLLTWTAPASLATTTKGGVAQVTFSGAARGTYVWSFVVPPGAAQVKAPTLPSPLADPWLPVPDASPLAFRGPSITFLDSSSIPSYALFRKGAGIVFSPNATSFFSLVPNGTFRATQSRQPPPS